MFDRFLSELRYRWRALFDRGAVERELDAELRFHIDRETEKHVRSGVPSAEAERRARAGFGGIAGIKDDTRDARGLVALETTWQDLRYALRGLRRSKSFTAGVVLTLGLGIGANAAMFGIVDRLLFRAPPTLREPDTVHRLYRHARALPENRIDRNYSFATYLDLRREARSFETLAAFQTRQFGVGEGEVIRELPVTVASASYFEFFDARPALGRFFTAAEDSVPAGAPVAVLGYAYWQTRFGGRSDIVGQQLRIDRMQTTIIGVAPEGFVGMADQGVPAAFVPITHYAYAFRGPRYPGNYNWSWLEIIARRRPGVGVVEAQTDLTAAFQQSWRAQYAADPGWGTVEERQLRAELGPVQIERGPDAGRDSRVALWTSGVALIVLLVACANVANLLLSRAVSRRREIAMRLALGVSRWRLARQLLTESLALGALGGVVGLVIAQWGASTLRALFLRGEQAAGVITDGRTLAFAGAATLGAALLTGLVPAIQAGRADLAGTLKAGAREGTYRRSRTRTALLVFQAALSVVLLVGAGLFVRSLQHVQGYRLGYDVEPVLFASANARGVSLSPAEVQALNDRILAAARALPGVSHATIALSIPFWSNEGRGLWVPGLDSLSRLGRFIMQGGSADYFATMGTRILSGRAFNEADRANAPPVMVVSEGMARALWPGRDPLGQCVRVGSRDAPCTTVVGVAEEARVRSFADAREFAYYLPLAQLDEPAYPQLLVRTSGRAEDLMASLQRRLQAEMPGAAYVNVIPLRRLVDPNLRAWRFGATTFVAFGGLALVLAAIGLYSLIAFDVAQRRQEFGVRLALGASMHQVTRLIVGGGLRLVVAGVVAGGAIALWAAPWLESVLFQQSPRDPMVFGMVAAVLIGVAVVASVAPARRAARVDPSVTLRGD